MKCVYCQQAFQGNLSLLDVLLFKQLVPLTLCSRCRHLFEHNNGKEKCLGCDKDSRTSWCDDCRYWQQRYPELNFRHEALFKYTHTMHDWFDQYKFKGDINLGATFSKELADYFTKWRGWVIIPIPLSVKRLEERGFNQVEVLLHQSQIAYSPLLVKSQHKKSQTNKSKAQRLATKQSFSLASGAESLICGQKILLVDDVYTTGRTIFHARQCLEQARPEKVVSFTLAR